MDTNGHENLFFKVGRFKIFGVFAYRANFFAVGFEQPIPIVTSAADEIAMLLDQQIIAILSGTDNFELGGRSNEMFVAVGRINNVQRSRSCPRFT